MEAEFLMSFQQKILTSLAAIIEKDHYSPKQIDDNFSKEIFKKYLKEIDVDKYIFLQSDINALKKYETHIDDELHGASLQFMPSVNQLFNKRIEESSGIYKEVLSKPFDFGTDETFTIDRDR